MEGGVCELLLSFFCNSSKNIPTIRSNSVYFWTFDLIGYNRAYHTRLRPKAISSLKTICPSILLCHVTRCTKLSVHRTTPDQKSAHLYRLINLQIKPITAEWSVHPQSNRSQPSAAPVYHARIHTVAKPRSLSLLSSAILSLSSDLPFLAVWSLRTTT